MPDPSRQCGSHVHVSPSPAKRFSSAELRAIAFGVIYYEDVVQQLLPWYRQNNKYCQLNTEHSEALRELICAEGWDMAAVWRRIKRIDNSYCGLRDFMQGSAEPKKDRYVLWNFDNTLPGRSGTVEFRGGRGLRGPVRTKRWIAFVVAFIHLCLSQVSNYAPSDMDWPVCSRSSEAVR